MPYKDPNSEAAKASRARAKKRYRQNPEVLERERAAIALYRQTPEGKAKNTVIKQLYAAKPENKERIRDNHARYRATDHGKLALATQAKAYKASPEGRAADAKRRKFLWDNDENYRLKCLMRSRFGKAMRRNSTSGSAIRQLGCTIPEFKTYIEARWYGGMDWAGHGITWHLDHIKALCLFDLTDPGQVKEAAHYTNLQPLSTEDHKIKTAEDLALLAMRR